MLLGTEEVIVGVREEVLIIGVAVIEVVQVFKEAREEIAEVRVRVRAIDSTPT